MAREVLAFGEALLRLQPVDDGRLEEGSASPPIPAAPSSTPATRWPASAFPPPGSRCFPKGRSGAASCATCAARGVDCSHVRTAAGRLGTYWVEYGRDPRTIEVVYDRRDSTVCRVRREDVPWDALRSARLFFVSGITPALSAETRAAAVEMAETARAAGVTVATDLNFRARLWSPAEAAPVLERLARAAEIVITAADDLRTVFGMSGEPEALAAAARERFGCRTIAVTLGGAGALCVDDGCSGGARSSPRIRGTASAPATPSPPASSMPGWAGGASRRWTTAWPWRR